LPKKGGRGRCCPRTSGGGDERKEVGGTG